MTLHGDELRALDNAVVLENGRTVAFTIKTVTGRELRVHCALSIIGDIFSFLGHLAKVAGEQRGIPTPPAPQTHNYLAPIPASGMALQRGSAQDRALLVVRLSGFDMAFEIPTSAVVSLADDFVRMSHSLSSDTAEPKN
jgi:hypothetical protein